VRKIFFIFMCTNTGEVGYYDFSLDSIQLFDG